MEQQRSNNQIVEKKKDSAASICSLGSGHCVNCTVGTFVIHRRSQQQTNTQIQKDKYKYTNVNTKTEWNARWELLPASDWRHDTSRIPLLRACIITAVSQYYICHSFEGSLWLFGNHVVGLVVNCHKWFSEGGINVWMDLVMFDHGSPHLSILHAALPNVIFESFCSLSKAQLWRPAWASGVPKSLWRRNADQRGLWSP